jgi:hypothetical protein
MTACTLVACPNPMQPAERVFATVPAGQTLAEMIGSNASHSLSVEVGGRQVPRELWAHTRPKAGQTIHATNYPQGGEGGKWVRSVAMIAIAVFAWYAAPYLTGEFGVLAGANTAVVAAGIAMVGQLAITPMIGQAREVAA